MNKMLIWTISPFLGSLARTSSASGSIVADYALGPFMIFNASWSVMKSTA